MRTSIICLDTGIVVHLVTQPDNPIIQGLWETWEQEQRKIVAPSLLRYEVTNVLYRYQKAGLLNSQTAAVALQATLMLPIEWVDDMDLHLQARELAEKYDLPAAYDTHYLALAERLGAELWTTDARMAMALKTYQIEWVNVV